MSIKAEKIFNKLAKVYYNPATADKFFDAKLDDSRATNLLKKKFQMTGKIADDVSITGGVHKNVINRLRKKGEE